MEHCLLSWGQHVMWPLIIVLSTQISNYQFQSIFLWVYWKLLERHIVHDKHPTYVGADFRGMTWVLTIFSRRTLSHLCKVICRLLVFAFFFFLPCVLVCSGCYNKRPQTEWLVNNRNLFLMVQEAGNPKVSATSDMVSGKNPLPGSQMAIFLLYSHTAEEVSCFRGLL